MHVLDIGTGTGLLAMMASRAGADSVTAVEVFRPMASLARRVFARNHLDSGITLIDTRSTDISQSRPNLSGNILACLIEADSVNPSM